MSIMQWDKTKWEVEEKNILLCSSPSGYKNGRNGNPCRLISLIQPIKKLYKAISLVLCSKLDKVWLFLICLIEGIKFHKS